MKRKRAQSGYTLIELTIAIAIIGILAAIAIPQFSDMLAKSHDGATLGNLGALRSALSVYYGDTEGANPAGLNTLVPKYLNHVPDAKIGSHK